MAKWALKETLLNVRGTFTNTQGKGFIQDINYHIVTKGSVATDHSPPTTLNLVYRSRKPQAQP